VAFFKIVNSSWVGGFFFVEMLRYKRFIFLSLFVVAIVLITRDNVTMNFLKKLLVGFSFFFFVPIRMIFLYFFFELALFPIILIIFFYGGAVEKIGARYYIISYTAVTSLPFFYFLLSREIISYPYLDLIIR
jgi:hypothetical protein